MDYENILSYIQTGIIFALVFKVCIYEFNLKKRKKRKIGFRLNSKKD